MRWLALACVVGIAGAPSAANARRPPHPDFAGFSDGRQLCNRGKTWDRVMACLGKFGVTTVVYDTPSIRVIGLRRVPSPATELHLYSSTPKEWVRRRLLTSSTATNELLQIAPVPTAPRQALRIDLGSTMQTSISVDRMSSTRGILRRTHAYVCTAENWYCTTFMTTCEAYVRGKLLWAYRGEIDWDETRGAVLRAESSRSGGPCTLPRTALPVEEQP